MVSFGKLASVEKDGKDTEDIGKSKNEREKAGQFMFKVFFLWLKLRTMVICKKCGL